MLWQFIYSALSKDRPLEWIYKFPTRRMSVRQTHAFKGSTAFGKKKWQPNVFLGVLSLSEFFQDVAKVNLWDVKEGLMRRRAAGTIVKSRTYTQMPMAGMCLEQTVEPWGWLSEDDRDEWRSGLWSTVQKPWVWATKGIYFCSWYKSHFGHCGKCVLVTKYSWKELKEETTYFGFQFWRFLPMVGRCIVSRLWRGRP